METFIPWRRRRSNNRKPRWMSRGVRLAVKKRYELWLLYRSTGFPSYFVKLKVQQKVVHNLVSGAKLIREKALPDCIASNLKENPREK